MVSLSPDHQLKLRKKSNLQHTYSVALEKTRIADLVNELRLDPERFVDLVRFTNLQNYHSSAWMDLPPLTNATLSQTWSCNLPLHFTPVRGSLFSQVAATASPRT